MIPRTFPSILGALGETKMVVYVLPSVSGLQAWKDYIPVKGITTENTAVQNTYANDGYQVMSPLEDISTKQAWKDYIPVFEDASYTKAWSTDAGGYIPASGLFSVYSLFANNEQGVWYDPSDLTTLFQDAAGTTPVTAVEQPVGKMLDKSGRGNHAYQTTSANRPTLSARYNLLTKTEQFDDAAWVKFNSTLSANSTNSPSGGTVADALIPNATYAQHSVYRGNFAAATYTVSIYVKSFGYNTVQLYLFSGGFQGTATARLDLGTVAIDGGGSPTGSITSEGDGWYRIVLSATTTGGTEIGLYVGNNGNVSAFNGDGTSGIYIWGADLRVANDGVGIPAYQRVNTATDYDTVGFPKYLRFNGSSSAMLTNSINFTGTDKMTVWAGVRKLSDAAAATVAELSVNSGTTGNTFAMFAPGAVAPNYAFRSSGTLDSVVTATSFMAPVTNVLAGLGGIASDTAILRVNGTQVASSVADQGTGSFGTYPLYIGARAGTSLWFNGRIYSLIIRGAQSTTAQITNTEKYVNSKTKAY